MWSEKKHENNGNKSNKRWNINATKVAKQSCLNKENKTASRRISSDCGDPIEFDYSSKICKLDRSRGERSNFEQFYSRMELLKSLIESIQDILLKSIATSPRGPLGQFRYRSNSLKIWKLFFNYQNILMLEIFSPVERLSVAHLAWRMGNEPTAVQSHYPMDSDPYETIRHHSKNFQPSRTPRSPIAPVKSACCQFRTISNYFELFRTV